MNVSNYKNFRVSSDDRGVAAVTIDVHDRPMNVFTDEVLRELHDIVSQLEVSDASAVVFQSGKESGFFAGADVAVIAEIQSPSQADLLLKAGQTLFNRIERLPMPSIAVIYGPCLGGGLEFALACTHRIAIVGRSAQIGLPEVKLGVIPGWGGTLRLPRRIGLSESLAMILQGKQVDAGKSLRVGLLERVVEPDGGVDEFIERVLSGALPQPKKRRALWRRMLDQSSVGQWATLRMARRSIASKETHYPALPAAINAIAAGLESGHKGLESERTEFVRLLGSSTCRNLLGLFFARERARKSATWISQPEQVDAAPVSRVGVVGAGVMGAGIGQFAATRGFDVVMKEIDKETSAAGAARVDKMLQKFIDRKRLTPDKESELRQRVSHHYDDAALADCDLVIEATVEKEAVKASVFSMLDRTVKSDAIFSSNTSSLSVTKMGESTNRPHQVAGLHFFNPVHRMELVEVVKTPNTDDVTQTRLIRFVKAMGKTPVVTSDSPGFLVNRVLFPYLREAMVMVGEGLSPTVIDRDARSFGMPMGPLELLDQVGIDVATHVAQSLGSVLEEVKGVVEQLQSMVELGNLGKKSGQGFYRYQNEKKAGVAFGLKTLAAKPSKATAAVPRPDGMSEVQRRLIYPMLCEAIRCHEESVVSHAWAIDLAMVLGTGFAPHLGGPLHVADSIGLDTLSENLQTLEKSLGTRFARPQQLLEKARAGTTFFASQPLGRTDSGVTQPTA